jgi:hypothetical protein
MSEQAIAPATETPASTPPSSPAPEAPKVDAPAAEPAKPADAPKVDEPAKPVVPEKYELKLGDGSKLPASRIDEIAAYAKEKGLSNEAAQEVLAREDKAVSDYHTRLEAEYAASQEKWFDEIKNDPELGGEKFEQTLALSNRVVERFGSPKFKEILSTTKLGNNPELVRFVAGIGKSMANDTFVTSGTQASGARSTPESRMFPNSN